MNAINQILVVLDIFADESDEPDGLPIEVVKALRFISSKSSSELLLVVCGYEKFLHDSYYSFGDEMRVLREEHCKRLEARLSLVVDGLKAKGYKVRGELLWGNPRYEQIVKRAIDFSADLVIQHTRGHAKLARTLLTNDSWQLVRYCPKPLLLVKDREWKVKPVLLAAVDPVHAHNKPLKLDHKIIELATSVAGHVGGELHVLHAYAEAGKPFALPEKVLKAHKEEFQRLLTDFNVPQSHCHLVNESPVFALQQIEVKLAVDIIVMGALSRSRLADALVGNTAERVLDYLDADVLIVKPESIS
ncbi:MAG: universal stress protein [Pseudohongiellaceae bacterium]